MAAASSDQPLRGCCLSMCPPAEMRLRQRERLVHRLECRSFQGLPPGAMNSTQQTQQGGRGPVCPPRQGDPQYFVKEFARSSAGREIKASDVRPLPVLVRTLRYLLTEVFNRKDCSATDLHEFVANRLRAVRQDLAVQGLLDSPRSIPLLAGCVRYYIVQQYRMCELPLYDFDPFLNIKQLQETLACLVRLYQDEDQHQKDVPDVQQFSFDPDDFDDDDYDEFFHPHCPRASSRDSDSGASSDSDITINADNADYVDEPSSAACSNRRNSDRNTTDNRRKEGDMAAKVQATLDAVLDPAVSNPPSSAPGHRFGDEAQEVNGVMHRIANLGLDAVGGTENTQEEQRVPTNKDDKNRENKTLLEQVKEQNTNSDECLNSTDERWSNIRSSNSSCDTGVHSDLSDNNEQSAEEDTAAGSSGTSRTEAAVCGEYTEREEIESVYLLLNYDNSEVLQHALELPHALRSGPLLGVILPALLSYHNSGNYVPLLRLLRRLPAVLSCSLYLSLPKLQKKALQVLSAGHSSPNTRYCLAELTGLLAMSDEDQLKKTCEHYGLKVAGEYGARYVAFHKKDFKPDAPVLHLHLVPWLDERLNCIPQLLLPRALALH